MKKKLILPPIICAFAISLTGCGHEHVWLDATCLAPKTCSECGETEGEAADHKWVDATCEKAKYCEVCGETDGEPLNHEWSEATYENPKTCSLCGLTEGEPLPAPYFIENNITFENLQDMDLPFAMCFAKDGEAVEIEGMRIETEKAKYTFDEIISTHSEKEGYIDISIPYHIAFSATIYQDTSIYSGSFGWKLTFSKFSIGDYYTGLIVPQRNTFTGASGNDLTEYSNDYEWNGNVYSIQYLSEENTNSVSSDWNYEGEDILSKTYNFTADEVLTVTIPEDFDGTVLCIDRNGPEKVNIQSDYETVDESDEYFLDEHDTDYYIFYRLSDLIR